MKKEEQLKLIKEVREIIDDLGGIDESMFLSIGINMQELLSPTEDTLKRLKEYHAKVNEDIERLDLSL
ncbi:MAG: hypothetical protein PHD03_03725 [Bacilli bacterium]|nr:hypothetical protein [Bacilli bacterium]MDD4407307.1 hypothetical protein [Bacilli bacterium]